MNPLYFFGMLAGFAAIFAEYLYKTWNPLVPWWHGLWMWTPLQLIIGYSIFRLVTLPSLSLLDAFVVFAFATALLRIFLSVVVLRQEIRTGTWIAFGLIVAANLVRTFWRT